ncbi:MAG: hypothetical protein WDO18_09520 [Acidobacteriota bacterium]
MNAQEVEETGGRQQHQRPKPTAADENDGSGGGGDENGSSDDIANGVAEVTQGLPPTSGGGLRQTLRQLVGGLHFRRVGSAIEGQGVLIIKLVVREPGDGSDRRERSK